MLPTNYSFTNYIYIYIYRERERERERERMREREREREDLAVNNPRGVICHKTQHNSTICFRSMLDPKKHDILNQS